MGAQGSVSRFDVATMRSLIKFMVAPESTRATTVEKRPIRETDRLTRLGEKRDIEVQIHDVRKLLTSQWLGTWSFPNCLGILRRREAELGSDQLPRLILTWVFWGN